MRPEVIIVAVVLIVAFYAGYKGEPQDKSVAFKAANGGFTAAGVVVVVIGFLVALWVLSQFALSPEDFPSPTDY